MGYSETNISDLQKSVAPDVYTNIDLDLQPERFRTELGKNSKLLKSERIKNLLADPEQVEFFRQLTLMGDPVADAYAALFPKLGFQKARGMLDQALEEGIESVEDAPQELIDFIRTMETPPEWLDWEKIAATAEDARLMWALVGDIITRVAFMLTYVNGYQGLPMIMTGSLSTDSAAKRMKETISTFKLAALPGALERDGEAFKSAAKVRVMHAMVRTNLLRKPKHWDYEVYGVPIPQVDQMGAALNLNYNLAKMALRRKGPKKGVFSKRESQSIEMPRYLAYLLGMHDQFLSDDPKQIAETWNMCQATLKHKYDDRSRQLNEATIKAYRRHGDSWFDKIYHQLDMRATRFLYPFVVGKKTAKDMGVEAGIADALSFTALAIPIVAQFLGLSAIKLLPGGRQFVDDYAVKKIKQQLEMEGAAEYKTDQDKYRMGAA